MRRFIMGLPMATEKRGSDIPAEATTSSVGSVVWPPIEANEQRKKGILRRVLETGDDLGRVLSEFARMPFGRNSAGEDITRISGRIFAANTSLQDAVGQRVEHLFLIEAVVPLRGCGVEALEDCSMVYLGNNDAMRMSGREQIEREIARADEIFRGEQSSNTHTYDDFSFVMLDDVMKNDPAIQTQYDMLYSAFGWSSNDVAKILNSPDNLLLAAFRGDELVSAGMAERVCLRLERGAREIPLVMYEITEAATKEEYRGNGLYTQVAYHLMEGLAGGDINLAYAESNLLAPGVLKSARRQGRYNTIDTARSYSLTPSVLNQHVRIFGGKADERPIGEKNDLLVTFIPRADIITRYGKNH